jgi:hypothetical protein
MGHHPPSSNALTPRRGRQGQELCVPWAAECNCFGMASAQPHPFYGCAAPLEGQGTGVRFRDVVSAESLSGILLDGRK